MAIPIVKKIKIDLSSIKGKGSNERKREAMAEVAEYLEDTVLDRVSKGISPVAGQGSFKGLSKNYKKIKSKKAGSTKANLELTGEMLDDFEVRVEGNKVSMGIHKDADELSKLKAENHNKWTKRARATKVPQRSFVPQKEQELKREIMKDIREIVESYASED